MIIHEMKIPPKMAGLTYASKNRGIKKLLHFYKKETNLAADGNFTARLDQLALAQHILQLSRKTSINCLHITIVNLYPEML